MRLNRNGRSILYPLTECGTRFTQESRKWYVQYRDSTGRWRRVAGYTDKETTAQLAAQLERKAEELASLTMKSFSLDASPPTVRVQAGYSKRRKNDVVPLHPAVVERLQAWLVGKRDVDRDLPLFSLRAPKGALRRTAKMMRLDLERARSAWIEEAHEPKERQEREKSDFLHYQDENGLYADFHANRHTFITNLARAGVHPKLAQSVARHSDVNLTLNLYSHVGIGEQAAAIGTLAGPPAARHMGATRTTLESEEKFAHRFAQTPGSASQPTSFSGMNASPKNDDDKGPNSLPDKQLVMNGINNCITVG